VCRWTSSALVKSFAMLGPRLGVASAVRGSRRRCPRLHQNVTSPLYLSISLSPVGSHSVARGRGLTNGGGGGLEKALCLLADRRLASDQSPLVLEIVWWRLERHEGDCGVTHPDTIMPKFREKGLIRFAESDISSCTGCAEVLGD